MEELQLEDARKLMQDEEGSEAAIPNEKPQKTLGRLRTATASSKFLMWTIWLDPYILLLLLLVT